MADASALAFLHRTGGVPAREVVVDNAAEVGGVGGAGDELLSITGTGATTFHYDTRGNRIAAGATSLTYDLKNRLTQFGSVQYAYNGDGLRTAKTAGGPAEAFAWDARGRVPLLLQDGSSAYLHGPGGGVADR
ncbi:MAG TPA: hypothetical protein VF515_10775 [Candidatus Binatia bacterium]